MKVALYAIALMLVTFSTNAQTAEEKFELSLPTVKISNSLYNSIRLVDARTNPQSLGIVQLGAFNRKARVIAETPLGLQVSRALESMTDSTAETGKLLLLLRQFNFAEVTGALSEKGFCHFRAVLFTKRGENAYQKLDSIDTVVVVKGIDVTKNLLRSGSKTLADLLATNLKKLSTDTVTYSMNDVAHYDSIEKKRFPLYNSSVYRNGIYNSFESFIQQAPDAELFTVEFSKGGRPITLKETNKNGKSEKLSSKKIYAFVYDNQPYIATDFGYYALVRKENDFYFTGKVKVQANSNDVVMASVFFGLIGALLASTPGSAESEMKMDHLSGGFIRIKEIR